MKVEDVGEIAIKTPVRALVVGREDNVAVLLSYVKAGEAIMLNNSHIEIAAEDGPAGYKVVVYPIAIGQPVITGGQTIGTALRAIQPGELLHLHSLSMAGL